MRPLVMVLNGPNLNLLGSREPHIYGRSTLDDVAALVHERAAALGLEADCRQSNHEGHLIDWLHEAARERAAGVVLNPGGLTHSSVALGDAVAAISVPVVEVHVSNPHAREAFRRQSFVAPHAAGLVVGFGVLGYALALDALAAMRQEAEAS